MIYQIAKALTTGLPGLWFEGSPYFKENIYQITGGKLPPVNYDTHIIKPHSITHGETELHVVENGKSISDIYENNPEYFFGKAILLKLKPNYIEIGDGKFLHSVTPDEVEMKLNKFYPNGDYPKKIIITTENYPENDFGYHDENYIIILNESCAKYLADNNFHLYGTSWKSSDYQPGKTERPIHKILLKNGVIFELLILNHVPEGEYYFMGLPVNIKGASESPVSPILVDSIY